MIILIICIELLEQKCCELFSVAPEDESSPDVNMSPHAERVLRRLHEQHVRFAVQSSSSASDVAVDAERLQRKYEELQERHARMMDALQKDLARSRRLVRNAAVVCCHELIPPLLLFDPAHSTFAAESGSLCRPTF